MSGHLELRLADINDADLLLAWRNDPQTRKDSHSSNVISRDNHLAWLAKITTDPMRKLYIAIEHDIPVGTARATYDNRTWELSWTVAPEARGRGVAKRMVRTLAEQITEPIRAEIKPGNQASIRVAEYAGLTFAQEIDGILHYQRGPK